MKKVTAIIPFYNGIDWLCEAVESVLSQTYPNIDIIVINDGSNEDVSSFLNLYGADITYIKKENGGVASARNLGIKKADGDYIALLDSDDIWLPEKISEQVSFMDSSGCFWSNTGYYNWWPEKDLLKEVSTEHLYGNIFLQTLTSLRISTPSVMFNRQCFIDHPDLLFPEKMRTGQDTAFYAYINQFYPLGLVNKPLMKVRMRGNNSFTDAIKRFRMKTQLMYFLKEKGLYTKVPTTLKLISKLYIFYNFIFSSISNPRKKSIQFLAKSLWSIPFCIERLYLRKILQHKIKDCNYITR